jgi:hypothetical protein
MKNLFFGIILAIAASSCVTLEYENPQPADAADLSSIPYQLQGTYLDEDNDTLLVDEHGFAYRSEMSPVASEAGLSDTLILRPYKGCYSVNIAGDNGWLVYLICRETNGDLLLYGIDVEEEAVRDKLKSITKVVAETDDSGNVTAYRINPTEKEFDQMFEAGLFEKGGKFRRIVPEDDK